MLSLDLFNDIPIPPETIKYSRNKINSVWSRWTALLDSRISIRYCVYPLKFSMPGKVFSRWQNDFSPENMFLYFIQIASDGDNLYKTSSIVL